MSARSADVTTRKPALSSASLTLLRSDAHTSGAPEHRNKTAALSEIVGAGCDSRAAAAGAAPGATVPGAGEAVVRDAVTAAAVPALTAAGPAVGGDGFALTASFVAAATAAGSLPERAAGFGGGGSAAGFAADATGAGFAAGGSGCCVAIAGTVFGGSVGVAAAVVDPVCGV